MSSRYTLYEIDKLRDRFSLAGGVPKGVKPNYNISPTQLAPVIVFENGKNTMKLMKWGFIPKGSANANSVFRYKTFNTRSETIFSKNTTQNAIRTSRCLIPANGFYEWKKTASGKQPFYIKPTDQQVFAFAGIYSSWVDPEGVEWGTYSMIVINSGATDDMTPSQLPVIVEPEFEADWLNTEVDSMSMLYRVMRTYPASNLKISKVGSAVDSMKAKGPELIEAV